MKDKYENKFDRLEDSVMVIENYSENYIPMQIQNIIIENMKLVLNENQIGILQSKENTMFQILQKQILDQKTIQFGNIQEEIIKINNLMTQRLGVRVDLRKGNLMNEEEEDNDQDAE